MAILQAGFPSIWGLILLACALTGIYAVLLALYNLTFHPLAAFPGPLTHRLSEVPRIKHLLSGNLAFHVADLHAKYGRVVRIAPNELAFCDPQAWKDIYGHKQQSQAELSKHMGFYRPMPRKSIPASILLAPRDEHALLRRQFSRGFSERSLREQEPVIGTYVELLIKRLRENGNGGNKPLNMREWLNWTSFDIIGSLAFGDSFGCLDKSDYHPWVRIITRSIKASSYGQALYSIGAMRIVGWIADSGIVRSRGEHKQLVREKVLQRMKMGAGRPDLMEGLLRKQDEWQLPLDQLVANASTLLVAGSETTATLLSGALFLLTTNHDKLTTLTEEIRSAFKNNEEITMGSISDLPYMLACLNESLRMYPPLPIGLPRVSPPGGATIAGTFVTEGTVVGVWQWAINHDSTYWRDPWQFRPERFLGDHKYANDMLDAMQPFSTGPRNCIGKNLAYAEMRLILAKIVFNFDLRLNDDSRDWIAAQKVYFLWDKPALNIHLTPAE